MSADQEDPLAEDSIDSLEPGQFLTEQAFHNSMESSISVIERTSKMHLNIYRELLRVIKPLEKQGYSVDKSQARG